MVAPSDELAERDEPLVGAPRSKRRKVAAAGGELVSARAGRQEVVRSGARAWGTPGSCLTGIARMSGTASRMLRNMTTAVLTSIESDLQAAM